MNQSRASEPSDSASALGALLYQELHLLAQRALRGERSDHTLQPTALAHEAWIRLDAQQRIDCRDREALSAAAAVMIRRILVDHARARATKKRDGGLKVELDESLVEEPGRGEWSVLELHELLDRLADQDERLARIVELRFFGGLTLEEIGRHLGISTMSVKRSWSFARSWLRREMRGDDAS